MKKVVLVTGASSGIGLEISKLFAKKGYNLVMISQNEEALKKAKLVVYNENNNVEILTIAKDLAENSAAEEIVNYLDKSSIDIDILVNNAGVQVYGNFHEVKMEDTLRLMHLNMFATIKLTKLFIDKMIKRGAGKVLNVASTGAFQPCPLNAVYCASKAFILNFSEAIGEELKGSDVTITTLCPGATKTNFARRANIEDIKLFKGKLLEPSEVASIGYEALMKGKPVVVTGFLNKVLAQSVRFMPRSVVTKIGMNLMKK